MGKIENSPDGVEDMLVNALSEAIDMFSGNSPSEEAKILGDFKETGKLYNSEEYLTELKAYLGASGGRYSACGHDEFKALKKRLGRKSVK